MTQYILCEHCDHFVDQNYIDGEIRQPGIAEYAHLEDGEQEFDHEAKPSSESHSLADWEKNRPDLFIDHEDAIGPNSRHHSQRGKE